jgi:ABC-type lipoprotein release transport system permease subunit
MNTFTFILRRSVRHWQLLLTLALGVVLATALLAAAPLLVNTVVEFGLRRTLLAADGAEGGVLLRGYGRFTADEYAELDEQVTAVLQPGFAPYTQQIIPTIGSRFAHPWVDGQPLADQRVQLRVYGRGDSDLRQFTELTAGEWPTPGEIVGNVAPVVIGAEMAQAYDLAVGDQLPLSVDRQEPEPTLVLEVSGIAQAQDPRDRYWFGSLSPLRTQSDERWAAQYAALVPEETWFAAMALFPEASTHEAAWYLVLDPAQIAVNDMPLLQAFGARLREVIRPLPFPLNVESGLDGILQNYAAQSTAVRAPLYFLSAEVVLLTLYYVIMVSSLAVRQYEREFAIIQSRGASPRQLYAIQATEAVLIAVVALFSGPILAIFLVRSLTIFGPLADVTERGWGLSLPSLAWLAALIGAITCLVGLLLPVSPAIKRSIVAYTQTTTRDDRKPFWQRYYLDVFVLLLGIVLLWRLQYTGSIVGGGGGRPQVDWLLLLAPVALLVGAGTILLRLFPPMLNFLARLTRQGRGIVGYLSMLHAARNPTHAARLVLLLTLAISLGILSTGINATLDESEWERGQYAAGSDVRLVSRQSVALSDVAQLADVQESSGVWRNAGSLTVGRNFLRFTVLGIEPDSFGAMTHYRDDFAAAPMADLLQTLVLTDTAVQPTIPLPGMPNELGVWLWSAPDVVEQAQSFNQLAGASDLDRLGLQAKLETALGDTFTVRLETAEGDEMFPWRQFTAVLPTLSPDSYPLAVHSFWLRNRSVVVGNFPRMVGNNFELMLDALTVTDGVTGATAVAFEFELPAEAWRVTHPNVDVMLSESGALSGDGSLRLEMGLGSLDLVGLRLTSGQTAVANPLPVLVSPTFLAVTEAQVGDVLDLKINSLPVLVQITGVVNYFPTLYDELNAGYLIINRNDILAYMNAGNVNAVNNNEVILAAAEGVLPEAVSEAALEQMNSVNEAIEAEAVRLTIKADPMALGLRSVTYFGFMLTTALSLVGFATHFYLSAKRQESVYGVLRSIGLSPGQLYGILFVEQAMFIVLGLAIGTLLGVLLNQMTLPGLPITFGDRPPTPPFLARNDWAAVGRIYLSLAVAFFLALGAATALLWRSQLHRALRVGEE